MLVASPASLMSNRAPEHTAELASLLCKLIHMWRHMYYGMWINMNLHIPAQIEIAASRECATIAYQVKIYTQPYVLRRLDALLCWLLSNHIYKIIHYTIYVCVWVLGGAVANLLLLATSPNGSAYPHAFWLVCFAHSFACMCVCFCCLFSANRRFRFAHLLLILKGSSTTDTISSYSTVNAISSKSRNAVTVIVFFASTQSIGNLNAKENWDDKKW